MLATTGTDEQFSEVQRIKLLRQQGDMVIQGVKNLPGGLSREKQNSIDRLTEGVMWLGMELKRLNEPTPYPGSKDPGTGDKIEPTADGLKL